MESGRVRLWCGAQTQRSNHTGTTSGGLPCGDLRQVDFEADVKTYYQTLHRNKCALTLSYEPGMTQSGDSFSPVATRDARRLPGDRRAGVQPPAGRSRAPRAAVTSRLFSLVRTR